MIDAMATITEAAFEFYAIWSGSGITTMREPRCRQPVSNVTEA